MHLVNKTDILFSGKDGKYTVIAKIGNEQKKVGSAVVRKAANGTYEVGLKAFGRKRKFANADEVREYVTSKLNTVAKSKKPVKIAYEEAKPGQLSIIKHADNA